MSLSDFWRRPKLTYSFDNDMTMSLFRLAAANCWVERKLIKYNKNANYPDYNKVIDTELNRRTIGRPTWTPGTSLPIPLFVESKNSLNYTMDVTEVAPATITQNAGGILDPDSDSDQQNEYSSLD